MSEANAWTEWSDDFNVWLKEFFGSREAAVEGAFFLPHLGPGMSLLDCGCGEGSITVGLAKAVHPGPVTGVDVREQSLQDASERARQDDIANVSFMQASADDLPFDNGCFDAVFAHALLEHVDPAEALSELLRVLKPGGVAGLRTPDTESRVMWPDPPAIVEFKQAFLNWRAANGTNDRAGRMMWGEVSRAGFEDLTCTISMEPIGTRERIRGHHEFWGRFLASENDFTKSVLQDGLMTDSELQDASREFSTLAKDPESFTAIAWYEIVARKPE